MATDTTPPAHGVRAILDPRGQPTAAVTPLPLAPRLDSLEGKTIYMVDVGFAEGWEFLEEAAAWFSRNTPSAKIELRHKKGNMFLADPDLFAEIKDKGHAVIFGVGG